MASKVLLVLTSQAHLGEGGMAAGSWLEELAAPYWVLHDAGCVPVFASIRGGAAPLDPASRAAPWLTDDGRRLLDDGEAMALLGATPSLAALDADGFDAIFLVGGAAVMWDFPHDALLGRLLRRFADSGRAYGGVCHGVAGLLNPHAGPDFVKGRRLTCISDREDALAGYDKLVPFMPEAPLRAAGAILSFAAEPFGSHAVRDGLLVTGQNPASAGACGQLLIEALATRTRAEPVGA
ncbi:type 1 glutamine amidotransferase domain-containing protein [Solimonas soli]|uniref:type 1 glutamine amidotransferase domain-containing protein n=1 Tax=Solimonas soli TaxID=413479 RepID=UPI00048351FB|nr:type 1 glutamine amidotransferase domain-containing protein [Solimonas soli]